MRDFSSEVDSHRESKQPVEPGLRMSRVLVRTSEASPAEMASHMKSYEGRRSKNESLH